MSPMPNLEELITSVRAETADEDPLAQLTKASEYASGLSTLGDRLLDHYVNECRNAGLSWAQLSAALKVSKQAAHKRFTGAAPIFQRFTDRARKIIVNAEEQARALGHTNVEPQHALLALARAQEGVAAQALAQLGVTYDQLFQKVIEDTPPDADAELPSKIPLSERSKRLLQATLEEALGLGHDYVGTEHIVLALHRDETSPAARFLTDLGADAQALRRTVERLLTDHQRRQEQPE